MKRFSLIIALACLFAPVWGQIPNPVLWPFVHGVASGDPMADRVIIWTRISGFNEPVSGLWKIATDTAFQQVVTGGNYITDSLTDYTVKVDVTGLAPDTWYYYRFEHNGRKSLTGRTKTLPTGNNAHVRLAVASCARVNANAYYNSYLSIARRNDLQGVVHLGDYIYETKGSVTGKGVQILPTGETVTLSDYRLRYNTYRLDPDLMLLHQQYPMISVWDDHETANDSWKNGAQAHDSIAEGPWAVRKRGAQQAYFEWLPIRPKASVDSFSIYRTFHIGNLADLIMIDSRLEGRDLQAAAGNQTAYADTNRTLLGKTQMQWLKDELLNSTAKWKIIGNQVMFAPLQLLGTYFSYEQWDGYQGDRNKIINHVMNNNINNVVVITGDIHTSWANDVPIPGQSYNATTGAGSAFVEFIGPSITTGSSVNVAPSLITLANPHIKYVELTNDGYFTLDLDTDRAQADWNHVSSIFDTNFTVSQTEHWKVNNGERFLRSEFTGASGFENNAPFAPVTVDNLPVGISNPPAEKAFRLLKAFPNPFTNEITVEWLSTVETEYSFVLLSAIGSKQNFGLLKVHAGKNQISLSTAELAAGPYYILVMDGREIIQKIPVVKIK